MLIDHFVIVNRILADTSNFKGFFFLYSDLHTCTIAQLHNCKPINIPYIKTNLSIFHEPILKARKFALWYKSDALTICK